MKALAEHSLKLGFKVGGSDTILQDDTPLFGGKATCSSGKNLKNIKTFEPELIVYTSAISLKHKELVYARKKGIKIIGRSQFLAEILKEFRHCIAVSGCHGKTTSTAMIARIFYQAGLPFTSFIGGEDNLLGAYYFNGFEYAVVEACEYKKNFLSIKPSVSVVLNIDNDHADSFIDMQDRIDAFKSFTAGRVSVVNADDERCSNLSGMATLTFGIKNKSQYYAKNISNTVRGISFDFYVGVVKRGRINLKVFGKHNVYNALSACAVAEYYNLPFNATKKALEGFDGVKRRMERIGEINGAEVYADYAHHPTEIKDAFEIITQEEDKALYVFQPHTYSRTQTLMQDFVKVFSKMENLIIYKTFPAREKYNRLGSAKELYKRIKKSKTNNVFYINTPRKLQRFIDNKRRFSKIYVIGAGDLYSIFKKTIQNQKNV